MWLAIGSGLMSERLAGELLEFGAKAWPLPDDAAGDRTPMGQSLPVADQGGLILDVPSAAEWPYLTHWTRDQHGPWPGESREEYLAKCVRGDPDCDRSALATLVHIVQTQQLTGTTQAIRGGEPVVCFTEMPLAELVQRRVFRSHRGQWDCESYGFCIRRNWLDQRGARPVYYGGDEDWERLPPDERPFFQLRQTRSRGDRRPIDWTQEREWRCRGSLDLRQLTAADGLLFVPSRTEALQLAANQPLAGRGPRHNPMTVRRVRLLRRNVDTKSCFTIRGSPDRRPARFGVRWLGTALDFKLAE